MSTTSILRTADPRLPDPLDALALTVTVEADQAQVIAHVCGEVDIATCGRLRDAIEPHLGPNQRVVLDLSGVTFMDSSCLAVLIHARTTLTADGGSLILRNPSPAAHRLLSVARMSNVLRTEIG